MKSKRRVMLALACFMIITVLVMGCTPARRPIGDDTQNNIRNNTTTQPPNGNPEVGQMPRSQNTIDDGILPTREMDVSMSQQLEDRIQQDVERINGVNNAIVLVNGNTAYVGIDSGKNITDNNMNDLKDQVIERTRRANPEITRVYVSSDMDTTERLRGYGTQVRAGRPITGFVNEIEEMFRRPLPRS